MQPLNAAHRVGRVLGVVPAIELGLASRARLWRARRGNARETASGGTLSWIWNSANVRPALRPLAKPEFATPPSPQPLRARGVDRKSPGAGRSCRREPIGLLRQGRPATWPARLRSCGARLRHDWATEGPTPARLRKWATEGPLKPASGLLSGRFCPHPWRGSRCFDSGCLQHAHREAIPNQRHASTCRRSQVPTAPSDIERHA